MADNFTTPVPSGTNVATKDIGGVHYPRNLITDETGADAIGGVGSSPAANTVLGRLKAAVDALGDVLAALQGTVAVSADALPLPSGAATAAKQDSIISALGETLAVSASALPLPSGASTEAKQDAIVNALGGTLTVDGAVEVTANALPLPSGAATESGLGSIVSALGDTLAVSAASLPLPAGAATASKQDDSIDLLTAVTVLDAPFPITPHASDPLEREIKGLSVVTGGTVVYRHPDEGSDRTITLPAGLFPIRATHIRDTSTAQDLTGF